ncbi:hypothetical protein V7183_19845, partial [Bacillus sp. JJ1127]
STPVQSKPIESNPITASHVSSPTKQVEVKPVNQHQSNNTSTVKTQQHVKEGADIKKVSAKAQSQQATLKNIKSKETIKPK